jgi:hypothetical protein
MNVVGDGLWRNYEIGGTHHLSISLVIPAMGSARKLTDCAKPTDRGRDKRGRHIRRPGFINIIFNSSTATSLLLGPLFLSQFI